MCIHNQHPKKHSVTQARQWHWFTVSHFVHYSHIFLTQWLIIRDSGLTGKKERLILLTLATFTFRSWYKDQISIDYYEKVNRDFMVKLQKRRKYRSTSFLKCNKIQPSDKVIGRLLSFLPSNNMTIYPKYRNPTFIACHFDSHWTFFRTCYYRVLIMVLHEVLQPSLSHDKVFSKGIDWVYQHIFCNLIILFYLLYQFKGMYKL